MDHSVTFTGTVSPSYSGQVVFLQRRNGKTFENVAHRKVTKGKFSIRYLPTHAGLSAYRIFAAKHGARPAGASLLLSVRVYRWHFLSDLKIVDGGFGWSSGGVEVNGRRYPHSMYSQDGCDDCGFQGPIGYNFKRQCLKVTATSGMDDNSSPADDYIFGMQGDGNSLFSQDIAFGTDVPITINVHTVLRFSLSVDYGTSDPNEGQDTAAFGNAQALCEF